MGKKGKGKKSGKKSGKKGGKKKGKGGEPQMTYKEAILAYQISIKEKQIEDFMYELRGLEEKQGRHKERNERLKAEQLHHIKNLLKQARDFEKHIETTEEVGKEQVVNVMKEKWHAQREEEMNLEDMRHAIVKKDDEIAEVQKQVSYWLDYKNKGKFEHQKQVEVLNQELKDMDETYAEMSTHLERTLDHSKEEIRKYTEETLARTKANATDQAISQLDKNSRQEVLDNNWLRREVQIHNEEAGKVRQKVEELEKANLEIMSELFECRIDDLKISRNFYLTQFEEDTDLDAGILELDLAKVSILDKSEDDNQAQAAITQGPSTSRPKSSVQKYVEDKVSALVPAQGSDDEESYDGGDSGSDFDPFDNSFEFDDLNYDDILQLGPLELKMLTLTGTKAVLHKQQRPSTEELECRDYNPEQWPVTEPMIKDVLSPKS